MFGINLSIFGYSLAGVAVLTILLSRVNIWRDTPVLMLVNRWLRWALFAGVFSYLLKALELSQRPDWLHFITGLTLWFLCETGYNWIMIKALSRSEIPLFPRFKVNEDGDEWPTDSHLDKVKGWLEKKNFKRLCVLKAQLFDDFFLRTSIYESPDKMTRVQILFVPKRKKGAAAFYTLCTNGPDGSRIITDNHSLPFGGYYPENWSIVRKPLISSPWQLSRIHEKRVTKSNFEQSPFEDEPLEELNNQQHLLEHLNTKCGFLNPREYREDNGRLSYDGRYRLWKEMWLLAYFGKPVS